MAYLHWSAWRTLYATGHFYDGSCIDAPCYSYNANVKLYYVKVHNSQKYFAWIRITALHHATRYVHYYGGFWHTA